MFLKIRVVRFIANALLLPQFNIKPNKTIISTRYINKRKPLVKAILKSLIFSSLPLDFCMQIIKSTMVRINS